MNDMSGHNQLIRRTRLSNFRAVQDEISNLETQSMIAAQQERTSSTSSHHLAVLSKIIATDTLILPAMPLSNTIVVGENTLAISGTSIIGGMGSQDKSQVAQIIPLSPLLNQHLWYHILIRWVQNAMKKKLVGFVLRVGITLLLFAFLFKSFSWFTLVTALKHVHRSQWLVGLIVGASGIVLSAYQWRSLLKGEQIRLDLADLISLYFVGIAFSHFLPTGMGGDAVKVMYVGSDSGNNAGAASATLMCRVTGFVSMILVTIPVLIIWYERVDSHLLLVFILLSLLVGTMIGGAFLSVTWLPRLFKGRLSNRLFTSVTRVGNALVETVRRPRSMYVALIYGAVFSITATMNCYSYAQMLGINVPFYFYFIFVPFISLISFLPISINGFGLRESAYVYAFSTVHVQSALALLLALFMDVQALLFGIVGGCIYLAMGYKKRIKEKHHAA